MIIGEFCFDMVSEIIMFYGWDGFYFCLFCIVKCSFIDIVLFNNFIIDVV